MLRDCSVFSMVPMIVLLQIHPILIKYYIKCLMNQLYVYTEISVISNVLTQTNIWKACRKRLNWHTHFQDKSLGRFQPSSESPRRFFYQDRYLQYQNCSTDAVPIQMCPQERI